MTLHLFPAEGSGPHNLVNLPVDQLVLSQSLGVEGVGIGDFLRRVVGLGLNYINSPGMVGGGTRKQDVAGLVLGFHPRQVVVELGGPLLRGALPECLELNTTLFFPLGSGFNSE